MAANNSVIVPNDIKYLIGRFAPQFTGFAQQDSQGFLRFLLDGLHEDLNRRTGNPTYRELPSNPKKAGGKEKLANMWFEYHKKRDDSIITDTFRGQLQSALTCQSCGNDSLTYDTFLDLSLPIPSSSKCHISDCFREFTKVEKLDEVVKCEGCSKKSKCTKKLSIWRWPQILVLHLKRFSNSNWRRSKLNTTVDFSQSIDCSEFAGDEENQ